MENGEFRQAAGYFTYTMLDTEIFRNIKWLIGLFAFHLDYLTLSFSFVQNLSFSIFNGSASCPPPADWLSLATDREHCFSFLLAPSSELILVAL